MATEPWSIDNIPDQSGRVVIVTGASSGIGLEAARALAEKNARVVIAVRDAEKGRRAVDSIRKSHPAAWLEMRLLDLADLASIKTFAEGFIAEHARLDILINNAGIMMCPQAQTRDGFEIQFGTNHLGHFALTMYLMPLLQRTNKSRVVVVSSLAHRAGKLDFSDIHWRIRQYDTKQAYCDSKLANMYFAFELAEKLKTENNNPLVTLAHPGWTQTALQRHSWKYRLLGHFMAQDAAAGALPILRAAVDDEVMPGDFFGPSQRNETRGPPIKVAPSEHARDSEAARKLWALSSNP